MYVDDFPGPLMNIKINNLTKVQETKFPAGVLEGQSPSILFSPAARFAASCHILGPRTGAAEPGFSLTI
jgi:hypothetical protein